MTTARYPSLFQVNTRVWLTEISRSLRHPATLDDIPDTELDRLTKMSFDWIWFLIVCGLIPSAAVSANQVTQEVSVAMYKICAKLDPALDLIFKS